MSYHFANHLAQQGHKVIFISFRPYFSKPKEIIIGKGVIQIFSWPTLERPTGLKDLWWYAKLHLKYKPDIVIGHFAGANISVAVSKIFSFGKSKTFQYYHTVAEALLNEKGRLSLKQHFQLWRKKIFYKLFCDLIICPSNLAAADLEKFYQVYHHKTVVNPLTDRFKGKITTNQKDITLTFLGRLDDNKGIFMLLEAYERYITNHPESNIKITIAGNGPDKEKVTELIKKTPNIDFRGEVNYGDVDHLLNASDFTIIPSKADNLPTVGLESLMNQTSLLVSNQTGLTTYLEDGIDCVKFNPNVDAIYKVLEKTETFTRDQISEMGINARKTYQKLFTIENYCQNLYEVLFQ
jgi:glycosyltransferase involved in cell wall biosynthesis